MSSLTTASPLDLRDTALPAFLSPVMRFWNPVCGLPGFDVVIIQFVDLFEGETFGFGDEEVGKDETAETCGSPDEEYFDSETSITRTGFDEIGRGISDSPVPQPVGCSGHRHCFRADSERIEFASDNPCARSPRRGEEKDVDTDKGDEGLLSGDVGGSSTNTNNGDNVLTDTHSGGADQEELAATEIVDSPHTREGGNDIDDIGDNTHHERV